MKLIISDKSFATFNYGLDALKAVVLIESQLVRHIREKERKLHEKRCF